MHFKRDRQMRRGVKSVFLCISLLIMYCIFRARRILTSFTVNPVTVEVDDSAGSDDKGSVGLIRPTRMISSAALKCAIKHVIIFLSSKLIEGCGWFNLAVELRSV